MAKYTVIDPSTLGGIIFVVVYYAEAAHTLIHTQHTIKQSNQI